MFIESEGFFFLVLSETITLYYGAGLGTRAYSGEKKLFLFWIMEHRQHVIFPQVINPELAQNLVIDDSMTKVPTSKRPLGVYLTMLWMVVNVSMLTYMILTHPDQPNSTIEMIMWIPSIAGLWLMKKWGAALAVAVLCITLGISLGNLLLIYGSSTGQLTFVPVNSLRIILNATASAYLFKCIFARKFT